LTTKEQWGKREIEGVDFEVGEGRMPSGWTNAIRNLTKAAVEGKVGDKKVCAVPSGKGQNLDVERRVRGRLRSGGESGTKFRPKNLLYRGERGSREVPKI